MKKESEWERGLTSSSWASGRGHGVGGLGIDHLHLQLHCRCLTVSCGPRWYTSVGRTVVFSYSRIVELSFCRCAKINIYIADTNQYASKYSINIFYPYSASGTLPHNAIETSRCMAPGLFRACAQLHFSLWTSDLHRLNWNWYCYQ